jgi:hypothetical protein
MWLHVFTLAKFLSTVRFDLEKVTETLSHIVLTNKAHLQKRLCRPVHDLRQQQREVFP